MIQIQIERFQAVIDGRTRLDPVFIQRNLGTQRLERLREAHNALNTAQSNAVDAHRSATEHAGSEKIGRRRGIALDMNHAGAAIACALAHHEALPLLALDSHAKARHQGQRNLDIRLGDQRADNFDDHLRAGQRRGHQKRSQKLARNIASHTNSPAGANLTWRDRKRRIAFCSSICDAGAKLTQGIDQITDGPLMHARHARQRIVAARQGKRRGQWAKSGARVAEEQFGLLDREVAGDATHTHTARVRQRLA